MVRGCEDALSASVEGVHPGRWLSLAFTIGWMYWYESTSGFGAGDTPVFWMLFLGPLSAAIGQLVALVHWWTKKLDSVENPNPSA
jgi:hypothetical protein